MQTAYSAVVSRTLVQRLSALSSQDQDSIVSSQYIHRPAIGYYTSHADIVRCLMTHLTAHLHNVLGYDLCRNKVLLIITSNIARRNVGKRKSSKKYIYVEKNLIRTLSIDANEIPGYIVLNLRLINRSLRFVFEDNNIVDP